MTSDRRNCITPREGMAKEQVTILSFRERFFYLLDVTRAIWCGEEEWMVAVWAMVHQHYQNICIFCPHLKIEQYIYIQSIMNHCKYGLKMNCETSSFETTPAPTPTNLVVGKYRHKCYWPQQCNLKQQPMPLSQSKCQHHCHTAPQWCDVFGR